MAFHLTQEDKRDLSVVAGIIAIIVFILLFHARNSAASPSNQVTPELANPDGGAVNNITIPAGPGLNIPPFPTLPPYPNLTPNTSNSQCGCGCAGDQTMNYGDEQSLIAAYEKGDQGLYQNYIDQVNAALPAYVKQFVNNASGYVESLSSQAHLTGSF
jgi:hypothetical protein